MGNLFTAYLNYTVFISWKLLPLSDFLRLLNNPSFHYLPSIYLPFGSNQNETSDAGVKSHLQVLTSFASVSQCTQPSLLLSFLPFLFSLSSSIHSFPHSTCLRAWYHFSQLLLCMCAWSDQERPPFCSSLIHILRWLWRARILVPGMTLASRHPVLLDQTKALLFLYTSVGRRRALSSRPYPFSNYILKST